MSITVHVRIRLRLLLCLINRCSCFVNPVAALGAPFNVFGTGYRRSSQYGASGSAPQHLLTCKEVTGSGQHVNMKTPTRPGELFHVSFSFTLSCSFAPWSVVHQVMQLAHALLAPMCCRTPTSP
ncbi:hypothetical protein CC80DRAFT_41434 [Byssothecium circinans]|uniref:Secreted protein n=1 Tax=Byssothecium circinans TaxID=147558 RepID=A0A6A5TWK5_9PLEO|nr:hypothetical protein CC80DRAFT_41434 [Byssothecium circinans]